MMTYYSEKAKNDIGGACICKIFEYNTVLFNKLTHDASGGKDIDDK